MKTPKVRPNSTNFEFRSYKELFQQGVKHSESSFLSLKFSILFVNLH